MIKIDKPIIVEGKYDKIRLENIVDAVIIPTDGFRIFKDEAKKQLIKRLAQDNGIIILTDSDNAGMVIRSHLKGITDSDKIINVFLPPIKGKEKRKSRPSSQGLLGVEGTDDEIIINALSKLGVMEDRDILPQITKSDLYFLGLNGGADSAEKRKSLLLFMDMPTDMSANFFLDVVNTLYGRDKFFEAVEKWKQG